MSYQTSLHNLVQFFEHISPATVSQLAVIYSADASFKDPFNEVRGLHAITRIFEHMFVQVDQPRFKVTSTVLQDNTAFLCWEFYFRMRRFDRAEQCIRGATHVRFNAQGQVEMHRDYWDAAEELYEKLPVLGGLMRLLKKAANQ